MRLGYLPQESHPVRNETVLQIATGAAEDDHHATPEHFELEARSKKILQGLSFRQSDFDRPASDLSGGWVMRAHLARGHNAQGDVTANWDIPAFAGAGALRSTMNDMLRFARANLDPTGGRLQRVIQTTHDRRLPAGRADLSIGMGWHIRHANGRDVVWHNGGTGGYRTWMGFDKSRKVGAVVLTNSTPSNDDLGFELILGPG